MRRRSVGLRALLWTVAGLLAVAIAVTVLGLAFAGSSERLPEGTLIAGVDVGGMGTTEAVRVLEERAARVYDVPVTFVAGERRWQLSAKQLELQVDWRGAVAVAQERGDGFGPVQGLRRLGVRIFGAEVTPPTRVYEPALIFYVDKLERGVEVRPRDARLRLQGLKPVVVPDRQGVTLNRNVADKAIVAALARFARRGAVTLPVKLDRPSVTAAALVPALAQARVAVSEPVRLALGERRWKLPRWRIAQLLELPSEGARRLSVGGPRAERYFTQLGRRVGKPAVDAGFAVRPNGTVGVVPSRPGRELDVKATSASLLAAALSPTARLATVSLAAALPARTTAEAKAMGVRELVSGYETIYGGDSNRIHNVRLVASMVDGALIAPGATFSFNGTTGERSADKGFLEAPVIINGELQTGLGGGVCQVSTTVFNAAYEAGLPIATRTNHSLYISHYPQGRDATVNYPDIDLKFVNDTGAWLLLRTFVGSSSLVVNLYGTSPGRRVESSTAPLVVTGSPPVKKIQDPSLEKGRTVVEEYGQPSRSTNVTRRVYDRGDTLIAESTWYSAYRGEYRVVRVGTKPPAKPKEPPKKDGTVPADGEVPPAGDATTTTGP